MGRIGVPWCGGKPSVFPRSMRWLEGRAEKQIKDINSGRFIIPNRNWEHHDANAHTCTCTCALTSSNSCPWIAGLSGHTMSFSCTVYYTCTCTCT